LHELIVLSPQQRVESLGEALLDELGALSVAVEDADAGGQSEQALFGEPGMPTPRQAWAHSTVQALFEDEAAATRAAAVLMAQAWSGELRLQALRAVADADWVRLTQSQFAPVAISPGLWVVPSWHEVPPGASRVIRLDPGMAFGTGTHPTTRMCLRWIARHADPQRPWPRVLDYGCGSGILAIAAALHGAQEVQAVDIDPAAVQAAQANAQANAVDIDTGLPQRASGEHGVVLANILATPLRLLAPLLCGHLAPGALAGAGRHPRAPGRRTAAGLCALARARSQRPRGRLGADDRAARRGGVEVHRPWDRWPARGRPTLRPPLYGGSTYTSRVQERHDMATAETTRSARVEARIAPDALAVVRRAAELQGRSVSDFLVAAALKDAHRTIEEAQIIRLSVEDQQRFAALLIDPPPLAPAMQRALEARQRLIDGAK